ncbi:MAG TPA: hypothetical protein VF929_05265 [Gemmatimonadaceae bacterium]
MSKTYAAPKLVAKGDVIHATNATSTGGGDPNVGQQGFTPGSVGFNL